MDDDEHIEEPPPMRRSKALPPARRSVGPFAAWRHRSSAKRPDLDSGHASRSASTKVIVLGLAALTVIGLQAWTLHRLARVRTDLAVAGAGLEEARGSLGMLWATTNRLDEDQMARLALLADSIRSVFAYAQGEVHLWEAAYYAQEQRLGENAGRIASNGEAITRMATAVRTVNTRLDEFARVDVAQRSRLDALERQDRTQGSLVEALARRTDTQEATVVDVTTTVAALRETLAKLDAELAVLEDRLAVSSSAFGQMDTRIDRLAGWVDGFRRAGLTGEAVENRLSALADELRRVRMRVDSLRPVGAAVATSEEAR
jgi:uncharacterized coiled-coil protein SlyX